MNESRGWQPGEPGGRPGDDEEVRPGFAPPSPPRSERAPWAPPGKSGHGDADIRPPVFRHADQPPGGSRVLVLSGWWRRAGAAIIDVLIVGSIAVAVALAFGFAADAEAMAAGGQTVGVASTLILLVVLALYAPVMMWRTNGRTIGRMVTGIRVVRANGEPMTLGVAATREVLVKGLLVWVASQLTLGLAGIIDVLWPLWDRENRALHDFPVDTRTIVD